MRGVAILAVAMLAACTGNGHGTNASNPEAACQGGGEAANCIDFLPAGRMQGVWILGFERSWFVPGAEGVPDPNRTDLSKIWLTFANGALPDPGLRRAMDAQGGVAVVAIEFDGRRSRDVGQYGHMGGADTIVIVDRIVSARLIGPLPPR